MRVRRSVEKLSCGGDCGAIRRDQRRVIVSTVTELQGWCRCGREHSGMDGHGLPG